MDDRTIMERVSESVVAAARKHRTAIEVGSFLAFLDLDTETGYLSVAVPRRPLPPARVLHADLQRLRQVFRAHERKLRFEYLEPIFPALDSVLEEEGFIPKGRQPLMIAGPDDLREIPESPFALRLLGTGASDAELGIFLRVQRIAFEGHEASPPTGRDVKALRNAIELQAMQPALAASESDPVGVACLMLGGGACELAGVGTLPGWRRKGVASAASTFLAKHHFGSGGDLVWLTAGDGAAERVYRRIGFRNTAVFQLSLEDRHQPPAGR